MIEIHRIKLWYVWSKSNQCVLYMRMSLLSNQHDQNTQLIYDQIWYVWSRCNQHVLYYTGGFDHDYEHWFLWSQCSRLLGWRGIWLHPLSSWATPHWHCKYCKCTMRTPSCWSVDNFSHVWGDHASLILCYQLSEPSKILVQCLFSPIIISAIVNTLTYI